MELQKAEPMEHENDEQVFKKIQARYRRWKKRRRRITAAVMVIAAGLLVFSYLVLWDHTASERRTLIFDNEPFGEVIAIVGESYNIKIQCEDSVFLTRHFSGAFNEDDPVRIMETLSESLHIHYVHAGRGTFVFRRGR